MLQSYRSLNWKSVDGVIEDVEASRKNKGSGKTTLKVNILYSYIVDGVDYQSTRITFSKFDSPEHVGKFFRKYKKGLPVEIFHHHDDPDFSVIDRSYVKNDFIMFFVGALMLYAAWAIYKNLKKVN